MRIVGLLSLGWLLTGAIMQGQEALQPVGSMRDVMVSMIHPAANELLLFMHRGAPRDDREWAAVQRSAVLLGESGNLLMTRGRAVDQGQWMKDARLLVDVGAAAYKAARARDANALAALDQPLNVSCVTCHKNYRPNVHPRQ